MVGTVKEVIHQISHSKKWKSQKVVNDEGCVSLIPSYRILQDEFFRHMQEAGFDDFIRGERSSDAQHLSCLEYQIQQDTARLKEIQKAIQTKDEQRQNAELIYRTYTEIDSMGKRSITGKVVISNDDFEVLTGFAKEGISSRGTIQRLESDNDSLQLQNSKLRGSVDRQQKQLDALLRDCCPYLEALEAEPEKVEKFLKSVLESLREREREQGRSIMCPIQRRDDQTR